MEILKEYNHYAIIENSPDMRKLLEAMATSGAAYKQMNFELITDPTMEFGALQYFVIYKLTDHLDLVDIVKLIKKVKWEQFNEFFRQRKP